MSTVICRAPRCLVQCLVQCTIKCSHHDSGTCMYVYRLMARRTSINKGLIWFQLCILMLVNIREIQSLIVTQGFAHAHPHKIKIRKKIHSCTNHCALHKIDGHLLFSSERRLIVWRRNPPFVAFSLPTAQWTIHYYNAVQYSKTITLRWSLSMQNHALYTQLFSSESTSSIDLQDSTTTFVHPFCRAHSVILPGS